MTVRLVTSFSVRVFLLALLFLPLFAYSQASDPFKISQQIGIDVIPPSTPAPVSAIPIATSQINVAWGTSTDNFAIGGYQLFRDASAIATTTSLFYSDIGLSPSTTYTYYVRAFDNSMNYSSSSAIATATTPGIPVVTPVTHNVGSLLVPRLINLSIETSQNSAEFSWRTNIYTRYIVRWGRSSDFGLGFIQSDTYRRGHFTNIHGLDPEERYRYQLYAINQQDREFLLHEGLFETASPIDRTAPANVSDLHAVVNNSSVFIQWTNPLDSDFAKVRVVRNYLFYPEDPLDGFVVYEGSAQSLLDSGALISYPDQYYTVYTYDTSENISSGAVVYVSRNGVQSLSRETSPVDSGTFGSNITFSDIRFVQKEREFFPEDGRVVIENDVPISVHLHADLLPEHLKTIVLTLTKPSGDTHSFLLKINESKTSYRALLRGLPVGKYGVAFLIYDFETQIQTSFGGELFSQEWISSKQEQRNDRVFVTSVGIHDFFTAAIMVPVFLLLLFLCIWWYLFVYRRTREDN